MSSTALRILGVIVLPLLGGCRTSLLHVSPQQATCIGCYRPTLLGALIAAADETAEQRGVEQPEVTYASSAYDVHASPPAPRSKRDVPKLDDELPPFDPVGARAVLNEIDVSSCRDATAPSGFGHAKVVWSPDGRISKVVVDEPPGMSKAAVQCVGDKLGGARLAPFRGSYVTMGTTFVLR